MKNGISMTVVAVALVAGASVAVAADSSSMSKEASMKSTSTSMLNDKISLTSKQQRTAWQDISKQATKEKAPNSFTAKIGAVIPSTLTTRPVPTTVSEKVPVLRRYQYALLENNRLLIVNPGDKKVADVITR
jgi:hypothetical protein